MFIYILALIWSRYWIYSIYCYKVGNYPLKFVQTKTFVHLLAMKKKDHLISIYVVISAYS